MNFVKEAIDFILHLDVHLGQIISNYGALTYGFLFLVIFLETGFVITPILPGDSLLFVSGAFAALGSLNVWLLILLLSVAAILGDTANYWIGHFFGEKVLNSPRLHVNKKYMADTHAFFDKYGGKTIILARFVPIIRTFAPFVAGIGRMHYAKFLFFNATGGILWVCIGTMAGFFFGNIPFVKNNFSLFVIGIVVVSLLPVVFQLLKRKREPEYHS
jgi:membrane-associated protein